MPYGTRTSYISILLDISDLHARFIFNGTLNYLCLTSTSSIIPYSLASVEVIQ